LRASSPSITRSSASGRIVKVSATAQVCASRSHHASRSLTQTTEGACARAIRIGRRRDVAGGRRRTRGPVPGRAQC
jgi:hypothetical protein